MKIIRFLDQLNASHFACVACIGNFDGVHLGHRALLQASINKAKILKLPAVVILFEPQPLEFFQREKAPARITTFREKYAVLKTIGVDVICLIRFSKSFADMTAQQFVTNILHHALGVRALYVGDDFQFGQGRKGDVNLLKHMGPQIGLAVCHQSIVFCDNERISSTRVRHALNQADFSLVERLLGRRYVIQGRVVHGEKRGRQLGVPTANISQRQRLSLPLKGVYAVKVHGLNKIYSAVANMGNRPTVCGKHKLLEVHLLDFDGDLYGKYLTIEPIKKIREEKKFTSVAELSGQLQADIQSAQTLFHALSL